MKFIAVIFTLIMVGYTSVDLHKPEVILNRTITVVVPNVTSNDGTVYYTLYDEDGFMLTPIQTQSSHVIDKKSKVIFRDVVPGEYAIVCYHDENGNETMDFQSNGMPLEDYGVSNNPAAYGWPNYNTCLLYTSPSPRDRG